MFLSNFEDFQDWDFFQILFPTLSFFSFLLFFSTHSQLPYFFLWTPPSGSILHVTSMDSIQTKKILPQNESNSVGDKLWTPHEIRRRMR
jgi:hypothetical protein